MVANIANALNNSPLSAKHELSKDIAAFSTAPHADMTFTIAGLPPLAFLLNPQDYSRVSEPVETELATAASWYTFRWQVKPALHTIQVYCGFQGKTVDAIMDALEGLINVLWSWPYLKISKPVKIMTVTRMRNATSPYGARYQIIMRELAPIVRVVKGHITQARINDSFLSPQVYTPTDTGYTRTGSTPVQNSWTSLIDAAAYVASSIPTTGLSTMQQYDAMVKLNSNLGGKLDGWDPGNPKDTSGVRIQEFRYAIAN